MKLVHGRSLLGLQHPTLNFVELIQSNIENVAKYNYIMWLHGQGRKMELYLPLMKHLRVGLYGPPYQLKHTPVVLATIHELER